MTRSLAPLFSPRAVAVVGASANPAKAGHQMLATLATGTVSLYAINPGGGTILGRPAHASITEVPEPVDLAVLTVPPPVVPDALADCVAAGVGAAIICAGGFGEAGEEGQALQERVRAIAAEGGVRLLGPNTSGIIAPAAGLAASFVPAVAELRSGTVAIVAQSGGVNHALAFLAHDAGIGVHTAVGLGNSVDVDVPEVLAYLAGESGVRAIVLALEGFRDAPALRAALEQVTPAVPVVALKAGRADVGAFAQSHTGALMGDWARDRALLHQAGAVLVDETQEAIDAAAALATVRLAPDPSPGVGVITAQAGPGLLIADLLRSSGIDVPPLGPEAAERVRQLLPPLTFLTNPVDTGRPGETFAAVIDAVGDDPAIALALVYALREPGGLTPATFAASAATSSRRATIVGTGGSPAAVRGDLAEFRHAGVPAYPAPERAARSARALVRDAQARHRLATAAHVDQEVVPPPLDSWPLNEHEAKTLLATLGVAVPPGIACTDGPSARAAAATLGYPVVVKLLDHAVTHKSEHGAVVLGVSSDGELDAAVAAVTAAAVSAESQILVEAQVERGPELIVGATRDAGGDVAVLLGLGGTAAEALEATVTRVAPLSQRDAIEMVEQLPGRKLIDGFRGGPTVEHGALAEVVLVVAALASHVPEIREIDCNPVIATPDGLVVADALIIGGPADA